MPAGALPGLRQARACRVARRLSRRSAFGPRFHAAVAVLSVRNRVSRRDVVECCEQLFGARISAGTVDAILERVADALVEPDADLLAAGPRGQGAEHGRDRLADRR